jgi:hypothetical protein
VLDVYHDVPQSSWPITASLETPPTKDGISCLSWGTGRFDPPTIAVGIAGAGGVVIYRYADAQRSWAAILHLETGNNVVSIVFAPNVGRPFHWLASAAAALSDTDGGGLVIYKLTKGKVEVLQVETVQDVIIQKAERLSWSSLYASVQAFAPITTSLDG